MNVDIFEKKQFSLLFSIVYRVSFISHLHAFLVSVCTKGFPYLLCRPRGRGLGLLVCKRRFSFREIYNFLLFNFFCPNLPFVYLGYTYLLRNLHRFPKQSFKRSSEQTAKLSLKVSGRSLRRCMSMLLFSWSVFLRIYMAATFSLAFLFNLFSLLSGFQNIPIKLKSRTTQLGKNKVL